MNETPARVLVLAPMRSELRPVVQAISGRKGLLGSAPVHVGRAGGAVVTTAQIGVGPGPAGRSARRLLEAGSFDHVVVSGIAGGIGPGVAVGDLVVPTEVEDLTTGRRFTPAAVGGHRRAGALATTAAELILDEGRLAELVARGIVALDMETAAVAEACEERDVPWSVYRVVSDRPEDGLLDHDVFGLLEADGSVNLAKTVRYVATHPSRVGALARFGRDASAGARRAAAAAVATCADLAASGS